MDDPSGLKDMFDRVTLRRTMITHDNPRGKTRELENARGRVIAF